MSEQSLFEQIASLPPDKQVEVADFVAFLWSRVRKPSVQEEAKTPAGPASFFGMWADRKDMADSVAWVRHLRETKWESRLPHKRMIGGVSDQA